MAAVAAAGPQRQRRRQAGDREGRDRHQDRVPGGDAAAGPVVPDHADGDPAERGPVGDAARRHQGLGDLVGDDHGDRDPGHGPPHAARPGGGAVRDYCHVNQITPSTPWVAVADGGGGRVRSADDEVLPLIWKAGGMAMIKRSVAVVVRGPEAGTFLVVKRPDDPGDPLAGVWGLPAVTLADGEDERAAAVRVGRDKLGVELAPGRPAGPGERRPRRLPAGSRRLRGHDRRRRPVGAAAGRVGHAVRRVALRGRPGGAGRGGGPGLALRPDLPRR